MKAVVFDAHGPLDALEWRPWHDPVPEPGEVLVKVEAAALNGFDPMVLAGIPTLKTPLPMIPGGDVAGTVAALGPDVPPQSWRMGDRVLVMPLQIGRGMMGETLRGGFCEYVAVPQDYLVRIPDDVSFVDAAALPVAYGTAHRMMVERGKIAAGETVLILGATGGVGTCCVQLAKLAGARAIACTSSSAKAEKLKGIGADHVINTCKQDWVAETRALCGKPRVYGEGGGVDAVVNYIGGESWAQALRTVRRDGRVLTCGATDGYAPPTDLRYIWSYELNIIGANGWEISDLEILLQMIAQKKLAPVIDCVRPMREVKQSMQDLMDRKVFGKAVLVP
jgi:alcohol dehydrogenase